MRRATPFLALASLVLLAQSLMAKDYTVATPTETVDMSSVGDVMDHATVLDDGKNKMLIFPVDAFGKVACEAWSGAAEGKEDMINRNCVVGWAQELNTFPLPGVHVYVSATPIHNCFATKTQGGDRIIVMDPFFIREYVDITCDCLYAKHKAKYPGLEPQDERWWYSGMKARQSDDDTRVMRTIVVKSILWHEWAHAQLHNIDGAAANNAERAVRESDADATAAYWIGWYLGKNGCPSLWIDKATVREMMVEVFSTLGELDETDHPDVMTRMKTTRDAFADGLADEQQGVENPPHPAPRSHTQTTQDGGADDLYQDGGFPGK